MYFYNYLGIDDEAKRAFLLGYDMCLTPCEWQILDAVCRNVKIGAGDMLLKLKKGELTRGNIAVHICAINKKAGAIGDRRLILCDESGKYYINEFM